MGSIKGLRVQLDELQLIMRAHTDPAAADALRRYQDIAAAGGAPRAWYSEFGGYSVVDRNRHDGLAGQQKISGAKILRG